MEPARQQEGALVVHTFAEQRVVGAVAHGALAQHEQRSRVVPSDHGQRLLRTQRAARPLGDGGATSIGLPRHRVVPGELEESLRRRPALGATQLSRRSRSRCGGGRPARRAGTSTTPPTLRASCRLGRTGVGVRGDTRPVHRGGSGHASAATTCTVRALGCTVYRRRCGHREHPSSEPRNAQLRDLHLMFLSEDGFGLQRGVGKTTARPRG
jgi:hypothetical protein